MSSLRKSSSLQSGILRCSKTVCRTLTLISLISSEFQQVIYFVFTSLFSNSMRLIGCLLVLVNFSSKEQIRAIIEAIVFSWVCLFQRRIFKADSFSFGQRLKTPLKICRADYQLSQENYYLKTLGQTVGGLFF